LTDLEDKAGANTGVSLMEDHCKIFSVRQYGVMGLDGQLFNPLKPQRKTVWLREYPTKS
jgi:hypothetical protein